MLFCRKLSRQKRKKKKKILVNALQQIFRNQQRNDAVKEIWKRDYRRRHLKKF